MDLGGAREGEGKERRGGGLLIVREIPLLRTPLDLQYLTLSSSLGSPTHSLLIFSPFPLSDSNHPIQGREQVDGSTINALVSDPCSSTEYIRTKVEEQGI